MEHKLYLYNTLTRRKENFIPIDPPFVGMYVCGPTVYSEPHLGHIRMAITFDILYRYLIHLGYKVRYVRNITDVGHLEDELQDSGEDKISKRARLEKLEPMEIVQKYLIAFHDAMKKLNTLPPSIEPFATGHIIEQQQMIEKIMNNGFAYESNGSVYFDIGKFIQKFEYGRLSGRRIDELLTNTRELEGQEEKKHPFDFALWKRANQSHIMKWPSKWSLGFPGWHIECSAMSTKYLGEEFDIHGGGMDLIFPHHECEIAQSIAANGKQQARFWIHNNMVTIEGQKMARSLNNFITLNQLFTGTHEKLSQGYSPMTIRFFVLQAHYRSTLDFSDQALKAAQKGYARLMKSIKILESIDSSVKSSFNVIDLINNCYNSMNDDLNFSEALAGLFEISKYIYLMQEKKESLNNDDLTYLKNFYISFIYNVLGLKYPDNLEIANIHISKIIDFILQIRNEARKNKNFQLADEIRNILNENGIEVKDAKDMSTWDWYDEMF